MQYLTVDKTNNGTASVTITDRLQKCHKKMMDFWPNLIRLESTLLHNNANIIKITHMVVGTSSSGTTQRVQLCSSYGHNWIDGNYRVHLRHNQTVVSASCVETSPAAEKQHGTDCGCPAADACECAVLGRSRPPDTMCLIDAAHKTHGTICTEWQIQSGTYV